MFSRYLINYMIEGKMVFQLG